MQLTIIKKNKLSVFTLPEEVSGNHWITDFENGRKINLLNIEATDKGWNLISNHDAFIVDNKDVMVPYTILKEYNFYLLKNNYRNEKYYLYCSPVYDKTFRELGIRDTIAVGYDNSCEICYRLGGVPKKAYTISKKDKYFYLTITDKNASVYINQKRVLNTKRIEYGDIIFTFGLKVILMRKNGADYLLVNNPNNMLQFNAQYANVVPDKASFQEDNSMITDDIYKDSDYFYRTPRFYKTLEKMELSIDAPPNKQEEEKTPMILTIGPMATMAMTSVVMLISTLNEVSSGAKTLGQVTQSLVMCGTMLASSLLWPILTKLYQKFANKMYERKRQKLYRKYLDKKEKEIEQKMEAQRKSLLENYLTITDCQNIIKGLNVKLWQRRITDEDFLTLPVGMGNIPMQIAIKYPEEHFSLTEDSLLNLVYNLGGKERILRDVPVTHSFYNNRTTGVVGDAIITKEFVDRILLQMMASYSYDELKIVTFTSMENESTWDYVKALPHSWANDKSIRYFGSSNDDYREVIYNLEKIFNERVANKKDDAKYLPHYVIVTDAIKSIDSYDFIKNVMVSKENYGFSVIMLVDKLSALPNECSSFISVNRGESSIYNRVLNEEAQKFKMDMAPIDDIYNCASILANVPIDIKTEVESSLPDIYQFLEMYQVGKIEQLNALDRWRKSNPILSLQAPIGIGKSGEVITLDLHEKYHGPHGLIAGTTGSGKSEFIITYILSLAVNYHPYEVQMILIDYKGGSLAGAFSNDAYVLPHIAGTITNLDGNELNRSLASIESEVKRRQKEFNNARRISNESTMDIYKYQKLWREGRLGDMAPISHLFIVSDEFAELKEQQPEFMDKLISVARVGRSLGVHLILATQKPGGVVDSQIWSNTRFRVCLKVQDTTDSNEVLKKPDAAYLKKTGRFYLQVGFDEVFTLGQSAWAGGQYYPSQTFKRTVDTSVNTVNNVGFITSSKDVEVVNEVKSLGEELPNVVKYLSEVAKNENIHIRKLWLDKIPDKIYIDNLKNKYNFVRKPFYLEPIIGEYDDPASQQQYALTVPFSKIGNAIVYGITGSGKEMFITSLIYSCMTSYSPEEVNFYIMDFGAETLRVFNNSPYVGDIVFVTEEEKLKNMFKMLNGELESRKEKFANFGGSYEHFIKSSGDALPNYIVIVNNYEAFVENYEDMLDQIAYLSREAFKYGIYFVLTASNDSGVRMKTKQNFALNYVLQQNIDTDYANILGNIRGKIPAKFKGRGLFKRDVIYEFQTASVTKEDTYQYLTDYCKYLMDNTTYRAKSVPVLPRVVDYEAIIGDVTKTPNIVIGINKNKLVAEKYNFRKNPINLISVYELENSLTFMQALVNEIAYTGTYEMLMINTTEYDFKNKNLEGKTYNKNYDEIIAKVIEHVHNAYQRYEESGFADETLRDEVNYMLFIYGISDFMNKLSSENKTELGKIMKEASGMGIMSFVIIDNPDIIKSYAYEDWFKNGCDTSRGIFIGSGLADQGLFRIAKLERDDREEITPDYGYVIATSKQTKVKLLQSFEREL